MKALPTTASVKEIRSDVVNVFAVCGGQTYAIVKATKYALGAARPIWVNDCPVRLISEQVFQSDFTCIPGEVIWLDNQYEILISVDGSPAIPIPDSRLKELRHEVQARDEEAKALREERDKPRQEQERQLRFGGIKAEEDYRLATAKRLRIDQKEQEHREVLRREAEKEQEEKCKEREKKHEEQEFFTKINRRQMRLNHDAAMLAKYLELTRYTKLLQIEQTLQAIFTVPGLQYTSLLEIELDQTVVHEMRTLSAFREESEVLECLANEQELQEVQRLQQEQNTKQEQTTKQEQAAKQKQEALDKHTAQYERSTEPLVYEKAIIQFQEMQHYIGEAASSHIIRERALILRSRCMKSRDAMPSASTQAPASDGVGTKVGAIMGALFGIMGGPIGMAIGAAAGGFIGNIADHASDSSSTSQTPSERKQWTTLISDIDELVSKLPE